MLSCAKNGLAITASGEYQQPLVTLLMTSEHVYWLKIWNAWFFLKQT